MPGDTSRVEVAQALAEQFGAPISAALMEVIPPFGWHEIANRGKISAGSSRRWTPGSTQSRPDSRPSTHDSRPSTRRFAAVDARFDSIDAKFTAVDAIRRIEAKFEVASTGWRATLTAAFHTETTRLVRWMVGAMIALVASGAALVSAVAALQ